MAGPAGFLFVAAVRRQRSGIERISFHVRGRGIRIMTPGAGKAVGIGHPRPACGVLGMAGLAVTDVHRVGDVPVAPECGRFFVPNSNGRIIEVRAIVDRVYPVRQGAGVPKLYCRIWYLA